MPITNSAEATRQANEAASIKASNDRRDQNIRLNKANQARDDADYLVEKDMEMARQRDYAAEKSIIQGEA